MKEGWEAVIGMEIHAQLATATKIFCGCAVETGGEPNSNTCPVCLGLPGALPVLNKNVIELGARAALALGLEIQETSIFARKNYFYPDLPKGYQISQYDKPFSANGTLTIMTADRDDHGHATEWKPMDIHIQRMHLEEDAGKNVHEGLPDVDKYSYVDLNRAGTPLGEIVTSPDFRTSWQAYDYVNHVRRALQWVGASDADMEKGNLRCEANVSVRRVGETEFNNKVELKNLNSVRFMQRAIEYEIERQIAAHEAGEPVALHIFGTQHLGYPAFADPAPHVDLPQPVLGRDESLGEEQIPHRLRVDVGNAPAVPADLDRAVEPLHPDLAVELRQPGAGRIQTLGLGGQAGSRKGGQ